MARTTCELLDWKRPNGRLKDLECRQLLEDLEAQRWLKLLADAPVGTARTETDPAHGSQCAGQPLLNEPAAEFEPLELQIIENRPQSRLWTEPIERHRYLKYRFPVGANLRYLVRSGRREGVDLACSLWSSPAWRMAARDVWIG